MRTFIRGNDRGNAMIIALTLILIFSTVYISIAPRINAARISAEKTKINMMQELEQLNREILDQYDFN